MGTIRQAIAAAIANEALTLQEISQAVGIREKAVPEHLSHIARSAAAHGARIIIHPARCLQCGFAFRKRQRYTRPSRCPTCRCTRITTPRITLTDTRRRS